MNGTVRAIGIAPSAGAPMQMVHEVEAIEGVGLKGDRYAAGEGSFNRKEGVGHRQVTLINGIFFPGSGFVHNECRRNIITEDVELMWLVGREFQVGSAVLRGEKYCDPCERPNSLLGKKASFKEAFFDRGGLVAAVVKSGIIRVHSDIVPPKKGY